MKTFACRSPNHPRGVPRDREMKVLEETDDRVVLACVPCRDIERILSAQVITLPRGVARAKEVNKLKGVARAEQVERTRTGRILYFS